MSVIDQLKADLAAATDRAVTAENWVKTHIFITIPAAFAIGVVFGWAFF